ncbi:AraC family transcriptional regulator [Streptomyces sp. SID335]|uniref:helix-turn-helix domain-containing protein n=1 Tax=Streptomyces TaxID=1883 RepID=UPI00136CA7AD|nr:helix-turn-helix domain-containing protein [Streptomyces sp. SID335]MYZ18986.1 helix-turn-helix domain-containing protein [Streptomyces sp. SID337]NDZ89480.1 helix-turn-helix transcriptional regulator [Streptomyces sp. SID10115]NEB47768.1 helix-turn-helix transcriptional regulator [Streptomyces sp. SID339]NEB49114.1 helix-turn-helix transcriptional regulator [Streptomyces sp. SID339]
MLQTTELGSVTVHRVAFGAADPGPQVFDAVPGMHALVLSLFGEISVTRGECELVVCDEAVALCDTRVPLRVGPSVPDQAAAAVVMCFPRSAVPTSPPNTDTVRYQTCDAAGSGPLLRSFLVEAAARASGLTAVEVARFGDAALHLAAAVLERHFVGGAERCPPSQQPELMTRVRGFIDRNLGDPALTPSLVAAVHHISIRNLQRLFQEEGTTPSDWIRQRRLENSRRELCDTELRSSSIREIGLRNGFGQPSDFSRVFRARYGVPPGRFRHAWFRRETDD